MPTGIEGRRQMPQFNLTDQELNDLAAAVNAQQGPWTAGPLVPGADSHGPTVQVTDPSDRRRLTVALTDQGRTLFQDRRADALQVSDLTLAPLSARDRARLLALLARLT